MKDRADAANLGSERASHEAIRQSEELRKTATQAKSEMSREATSLRADVQSSRSELQAANKLTPEIEGLRTQLAKANSDIRAQQKLLSSSQDFVKGVFSSHVTELFSFKLTGGLTTTVNPQQHYVICPPTGGGNRTIVLMLLNATPIQNTLQLQQRVALQPFDSFSNIHNLVIFYWGDPPTGLASFPVTASYFPDKSDTELIHSLTERDGRVFADDQPMPKLNQPDPDFKGNKWIRATDVNAAKP
jgi:hypothetical protein